MEILSMFLEMIGQLLNARCQKGRLHLAGTRILPIEPKFFNDPSFINLRHKYSINT
jgi:hypothetical protein